MAFCIDLNEGGDGSGNTSMERLLKAKKPKMARIMVANTMNNLCLIESRMSFCIIFIFCPDKN